jgi:hypothetical protein
MAGLGLIFLVLPITVILITAWLFTKKSVYGKVLLLMWGGLVFLGILSIIINTVFSKKILEKSDFYGKYIIDRDYFSGKQADWQYNNFRFEIKKNDSIYFYVTDKERILKTYKGTISTLKPYQSARLVIKMEQPTHHVLTTDPTIYRHTWDFYLVFNSPKYNNMYFRKGEWQKLN